MTCPRCGFEGGATPSAACARCGIVFAKMTAAAARSRPPAHVADARVGKTDGRGGLWILLAALGTAAAFGLFVWRRPTTLPVASGPGPATTPVADSEPLPPPPLAPVTVPASDEPIALRTDAVPPEDRADAEALIRRMSGSLDLTARDIEIAEHLYGRYPQEAPVRQLLERVLMTAAARESRSKRLAPAVSLLRRATEVQPASIGPWLALSQVLLEQADWAGAEAAARSALGLEPHRFEALQALGYALIRQDRNREAEEALRAAVDVRADPGTQALLDRVRKGLADEQGMAERQLAHFHVRYDGDAHEEVGREILSVLERHYATLVVTLDHQPQATIPVILFSRQGYYDAAGAPIWSGGAYDTLDGRIRVPIGGLSTRLTPDMDHTLIHELTHAFVADLTRGLAPRDIHEGLAQYLEGRRLGSDLTDEQVTALADGRVGGVAGFYLAALGYVEHLIALRGMGGMVELLRAMGETGNVDKAFRQVHGHDHRASRVAWAERLRMQHGS